MLPGQVIVGGCVSLTVIVKLQVAVSPAASVAVQVTVLVPIGNGVPLAGLPLTVAPGQLSVGVGSVAVTTAAQSSGSARRVLLAGQVIVGGCVSVTVTLQLQVALS